MDFPVQKKPRLRMKGYNCSLCGKNFHWQSQLKRHMCNRKKTHKCLKCSKSFNCLTDLRAHQREHKVEKPYKCSQCAKRFNRPSHLSRHLRIHAGRKPYRCDQCQKGFNIKHDLLRHPCIKKQAKILPPVSPPEVRLEEQFCFKQGGVHLADTPIPYSGN